MRCRGAIIRLRYGLLTAFAVLCLALLMRPEGRSQTPSDTAPTITFSKDFPGSQPDYFSVILREDGEAEYRISPDDEPIKFSLSPAPTQEIFTLARKLNFFREGQLESKRRVANMGKKTVAYQHGTARSEASFNHTEVPEALALTALFERISQTQQHQLRLQYLLRHDRLGVVKELLQLESYLDQQRLLDPEQLLPLLEQIKNDGRLIRVAQERATRLIEKIHSAKP